MTNPLPLLSLPPLQLPDFSHLSRASSSWLATLGVGLAIGLPIGAAADSTDTEASPRPGARWFDSNAKQPPDWMGENVYYKKGAGLEYRQEAKFRGSPIEIGVQGPLVRTKKDTSAVAEPGARPKRMSGVGLTFEVRF